MKVPSEANKGLGTTHQQEPVDAERMVYEQESRITQDFEELGL